MYAFKKETLKVIYVRLTLSYNIIYTNSVISIHKNQNNVWDNKAYSVIIKTHFLIISSNGKWCTFADCHSSHITQMSLLQEKQAVLDPPYKKQKVKSHWSQEIQ